MESALKDMRGKDTVVDSQTGDEQFEALAKFGQDLTAQAAHLDPVRLHDRLLKIARGSCMSMGLHETGKLHS